MNTFIEAGIVIRRDFGHGKARYESSGARRHDHLVDEESGAIVRRGA